MAKQDITKELHIDVRQSKIEDAEELLKAASKAVQGITRLQIIVRGSKKYFKVTDCATSSQTSEKELNPLASDAIETSSGGYSIRMPKDLLRAIIHLPPVAVELKGADKPFKSKIGGYILLDEWTRNLGREYTIVVLVSAKSEVVIQKFLTKLKAQGITKVSMK